MGQGVRAGAGGTGVAAGGGGPVTYVGVSDLATRAGTGSGTIAVDTPGDSGNTLVLYVTCESTISTPSGWTQIRNSNELEDGGGNPQSVGIFHAVFTKTSAGESSVDVTVDNPAVGICVALSHGTVSLEDEARWDDGTHGITMPSVTTPNAPYSSDALLLELRGTNDDNTLVTFTDNDMTSVAEGASYNTAAVSTGRCLGAAYVEGGGSPTMAVWRTSTNSTSADRGGGILLVISPGGGGGGGGSSSPEFVGGAYSSTTSVTIPAHDAGDTAVLLSNNAGTATAPASGWTTIQQANITNSYLDVHIKELDGVETSVTVASAEQLAIAIFRGVNGYVVGSTNTGAGSEDWDAPAGASDTVDAIDIVMLTAWNDTGGGVAPAGFSEGIQGSNTGGTDQRAEIWYRVNPGVTYAGEADIAAMGAGQAWCAGTITLTP